jgi:hypothetical protein
LSLDKQGFQLVGQETAVHDFYDRAEVEKVYYPEIERLLKQVTGAEKAVTFDHQVRNIQLSKQGEKNARDYVWAVHNAYTAKSGPRRVRDPLAAAEADERLRHRFAEINAWRPIRGPIESTPLAVCDAQSIDPRILFRQISFIVTRSVRSTASLTTLTIAGSIFPISSGTR